MFTVSKAFHFEAAHSLPHLPEWHKCRNLHGHSYVVIVHCAGELDERGFVVDYAEITEAMLPVICVLDHKNLNELLDPPTTSENLAKWIHSALAGKLPTLCAVEVKETATTSVVYRP